MPAMHVLIVDDEPAIRQLMSIVLSREGYEVDAAASGAEAQGMLSGGDYDVVLCDIQMPGMSGIELVRRMKQQGSDATFIMVTAFASMDTAIEALKAGATDYIIKPVRNEEILHRLAQIGEMRGLRDENRALRDIVHGSREDWFRFRSAPMLEVERMLQKVAPTDSTVLVSGESGTGKGVVARQIHELSRRREAPFVQVNCGAIPENLLESEFFGHTKGAFTSADRARKGLFMQANGGTIFLDEIGELPLLMQTKLLHVIEDKEVRQLGSEASRKVDVRIIAATNRNLPEMVAANRFREDLYYRLGVFTIRVPSLQERRSDLPELLRFVLRRVARAANRERAISLDPLVEELLVGYGWPGNVRELDNVIQRAFILADGDTITLADLPPEVARDTPGGGGAGMPVAEGGLREQLRRLEMEIILRAIGDAGGDRRLAAQGLGIGLSSLYRKLEQFGQEEPPTGGEEAQQR